MSIFLDTKYLTLLSSRLPLFKKKSENTYNCRCVICGDSAKKVNKARGYFFPNKDSLMYKCFNCDASMFFSTFLKQQDNMLYQQYSFEKYTEGQPLKLDKEADIKFKQPEFKSTEKRLIDKILERVDQLPDDNEAVLFCQKRMIPKDKFNRIYFISNIKNIVQLSDKYKESIKTEEPRLVLPFFNESHQLSGVTCRALRGEALRYITVKVKDHDPLIFGLEEVDKTKDVYVVEGPIDSLFLDNAIAMSGIALSRVELSSIDKDKLVIVFDNQPRNSEVCKALKKAIDGGYKVVIWPQAIEEKDINDMVLAGKNVKKIVKENTHSGLQAVAKFVSWKRV